MQSSSAFLPRNGPIAFKRPRKWPRSSAVAWPRCRWARGWESNAIHPNGRNAAEAPKLPARSRLEFARLGGGLLGLVLGGIFLAGRFGGMRRPVQPASEVREKSEAERGPAPRSPVIVKPARTLAQHTSNVLALAFSPDGKVLASGSRSDVILLWDVETGTSRVINTPRDDVSGLAFSPDGSTLASVSWGLDLCAVRLWDVRTALPAGLLGPTSQKGNGAVGYSPDGTLLAYGGFERTLSLFNLADPKQSRTIPGAVTGLIRGLSFSPDGRWIAVGGFGAARLWDATTGEEVPTEQPLPNDMNPLFVPGRNELAGWHHHEGRVTLSELPSGRVRASWRAHSREIEGLAVSPDGRFLASTGREGMATHLVHHLPPTKRRSRP